RRAADLIASEFRRIYPQPQLVDVRPTDYLGEVLRPNYPSVLVEVAYHDNPEDAAWILNNFDAIARALANAVQRFVNP
ncbi:MAG: N-acetylmuramoyl-L-alanine amidase, partial [Clostridia bacterium]|nr:N-acetylmuramoyl-L-alanine amidase [Clostridia bacterium]